MPKEQMAAQPRRPGFDKLAASARPIELLTENAFSILRPWEIEEASPPATGQYVFLVRTPHDQEREIVVEVTEDLVTTIERHSRGRVVLSSSFWPSCAERHLASYLWENNDCPPDGKLNVAQLTPEDFDQAMRWGRTGGLLI